MFWGLTKLSPLAEALAATDPNHLTTIQEHYHVTSYYSYR